MTSKLNLWFLKVLKILCNYEIHIIHIFLSDVLSTNVFLVWSNEESHIYYKYIYLHTVYMSRDKVTVVKQGWQGWL